MAAFGRLEVFFEVDGGVVACVVLLNVVERNKYFLALVALEEVLLLLGWHFKQEFVGGKGLLLDLDFFAQIGILYLALFDCLLDVH